MFSYEKLRVYQAARTFVAMRAEVIKVVPRRVAAIDHLERAGESVALNITHASNAWGAKERNNYISHANGSALECAAALDILEAKDLVAEESVRTGKEKLGQIVGMLFGWRQSTSNRVCEDLGEYLSVEKKVYFGHESLDVYQLALRFTGLIEKWPDRSKFSSDLFNKIDKGTTSVVLNIAEGNGRYNSSEKATFLGIAYKAAVQSSALIDLAMPKESSDRAIEAQAILQRIAMMIAALKKAVT